MKFQPMEPALDKGFNTFEHKYNFTSLIAFTEYEKASSIENNG